MADLENILTELRDCLYVIGDGKKDYMDLKPCVLEIVIMNSLKAKNEISFPYPQYLVLNLMQ